MTMRLRLALYVVASLVLLAVYEPARALGAIVVELRERLSSLGGFGSFGL